MESLLLQERVKHIGPKHIRFRLALESVVDLSLGEVGG